MTSAYSVTVKCPDVSEHTVAAGSPWELRQVLIQLANSVRLSPEDRAEQAVALWDFYLGELRCWLTDGAGRRYRTEDGACVEEILARVQSLVFDIEEWDNGYYPGVPLFLDEQGGEAAYSEHADSDIFDDSGDWVDCLELLSGKEFGRAWYFELHRPTPDAHTSPEPIATSV